MLVLSQPLPLDIVEIQDYELFTIMLDFSIRIRMCFYTLFFLLNIYFIIVTALDVCPHLIRYELWLRSAIED